MDPKACIQGIKDAMSQLDVQAARERLGALNGWLRKGGFIPQGWTRATLRAWVRVVGRDLKAMALTKRRWSR